MGLLAIKLPKPAVRRKHYINLHIRQVYGFGIALSLFRTSLVHIAAASHPQFYAAYVTRAGPAMENWSVDGPM